MMLTTLCLEGDNPHAMGQCHGETLREKIADLYAIRLHLTFQRTALTTEDEVLELAREHIPILDAFDADLAAEMRGISEGAGLPLEKVILLNHYTDFRDLSRPEEGGDDPGGCSALFCPTKNGAVLGQTWDMHGSAEDHVILLRLPRTATAPAAMLFTISGCVGMTGMNTHGVAMTINNLNSLDAKVGIVWPVLVRRCLREQTAALARDIVMNAPLGSGHHYMVADDTDFFGIETSGELKKITQEGVSDIHLHTNHPLDTDLMPTAIIPDGSTSFRRLARLETLQAKGFGNSPREIYARLAAVSMKRDLSEPHKASTCGAFVMATKPRLCYAGHGPVQKGQAPIVFAVRS